MYLSVLSFNATNRDQDRSLIKYLSVLCQERNSLLKKLLKHDRQSGCTKQIFTIICGDLLFRDLLMQNTTLLFTANNNSIIC